MATPDPGQDPQKRMKDLIETASILKDSFISIGEALKKTLVDGMTEADRRAETYKEAIKSVNDQVKKLGKSTEKLLENEADIITGQLTSKAIYQQQLGIQKRRLILEQNVRTALTGTSATQEEINRHVKELNEKLDEESEELEKQLDLVKKREKLEKSLQQTIKGYTAIVKGMQRIPFLGSLVDASAVQEKMNKYAQEYQERTGKTASKLRTLGVGISETFKSIGLSLLNPMTFLGTIIGLIKSIIQMVMEWEQTTFDIAKNLGVSVSHAERFRNAFAGIQGAALTSKQVAESYAKIADQLGFLVPANDAFAGTAAKLEKRLGVSADAMAGLATAGAMAGMNLNKAFATAVGFAKVSGARNKLALTERQIIGEISKVSSAVLVNFKGNLPALAEAVVRAKKLGTTLDQIAKQGEALLDFENSIAAQFEAEVMTGREMNLNRARELALAGKTAELGEELKKQGVTLAEFSAMDQFSKEATAKAIGLSTEELSKQLVLQKQAEQLGAKEGQALQNRYNQMIKEGKSREYIAGLIGNSAEAELNRASTAERIEAIMFRLKETLASMVAGPVLGLVNQMVSWLSNAVNIKKVADGIKFVFEGLSKVIKELPGYLEKAIVVAKVLAGISLARAVFSIAAVLVANPALALGAVIAAPFIAQQLKQAVPKFAMGGIVDGTSESGDNTVAMVNAGEMILNKNQQARLFQMANTGGGQGGQPVNITLNTVLDGEIVATKVVKHMPKLKTGTTDGNTSII